MLKFKTRTLGEKRKQASRKSRKDILGLKLGRILVNSCGKKKLARDYFTTKTFAHCMFLDVNLEIIYN